MPSVTLPITSDGVIVEAMVFRTGIRQRASLINLGLVPQPEFRKVRLVLDTGAGHTFLNHDVTQALGLDPRLLITVQTIATGATPLEKPAYDVSLVILLDGGETRTFDPVIAAECDLAHQGIDGIVGCDVLNQGRMVWDGPNRSCTLTF